ncbi:MAG: type III pantothenate kinase [Pirellulales bacterium]|nr:type III pantothenate kinase [Pirellulales bacterium]
MTQGSLIAIDVGNARVKLGRFGSIPDAGLPEPMAVLPLDGEAPDWDAIQAWLGSEATAPPRWSIASVSRPTAGRLLDWLREHRPDDPVALLSTADLPLEVRLPRPDMVGIDRLADAVAVNRLREKDRPAVIVDVGTAITVDLVSADGTFLGGAILPGLAMAARALHDYTDLLPLIETKDLSAPPPALGQDTESAMQSGLFWGAVGAVRQLTDELARSTGCSPQVFLTGGAGPTVAPLIGPQARHFPHLTLAGIALATQR